MNLNTGDLKPKSTFNYLLCNYNGRKIRKISHSHGISVGDYLPTNAKRDKNLSVVDVSM